MIKWYADDVLRATNSVIADVSKDVAKDVERDAKNILKRKASRKYGGKKKAYGTSVGGLIDQFQIKKSKFKDGGYIVQTQGPGKWLKPYHASFVEMGTYKDIAQPFMRPAVKKNNRPAQKKFRDELEKKYRQTA